MSYYCLVIGLIVHLKLITLIIPRQNYKSIFEYLFNSPRPNGYWEGKYFKFSQKRPHISLCSILWPPGQGRIWPQGHNLNKLGRGLQFFWWIKYSWTTFYWELSRNIPVNFFENQRSSFWQVLECFLTMHGCGDLLGHVKFFLTIILAHDLAKTIICFD